MNRTTFALAPALLILTGCYPSNYVEITPEQRATNLIVTGKQNDLITFSDGQIGRAKDPNLFPIGAQFNSVVIKGWGTGEIKRAVRVVPEDSGLMRVEDTRGACWINSRADADSMICN